MPVRVGIGFSQNSNPQKAAREAAQQAKGQLKRDRIDFAFILNTAQYAPEKIVPVIYEEMEQTKVIGSSTTAMVLGDQIEKRGVAVVACYSDNVRFATTYIRRLDLQNMMESGRTLGKHAAREFSRQNMNLFLLIADGLLKNTSELVAGVKSQFPNAPPIIGAGSSDDFHFSKTYQYYNNTVMTQSAVGVLLGGILHCGMSCRHGYRPLGKPRVINDIDHNIIRSIDHQKAVNIYREYFNEEAEALKVSTTGQINIRYPLGVHYARSNEYLLRNVLNTLEDGSIVCQDSVAPQSEVHVMFGNKDFCIQAAEEAAFDVREQLKGKPPSLIMVFESAIRYKLLGRSCQQEIQLIRRILGDEVPLIGMYSCGEIFDDGNTENMTQVHRNGSIAILAFT